MRRVLLGLAVLGLLTGCTTIPSSSGPEVVRAIPKAEDSQTAQANTGPGPNDGIPAIMQGFLKAAPVADGGHSQARQFLTSAASRKWQDETTIILNDMYVRDPVISGDTASVTISGRRVGVIDKNGVLSPTLKGSGTGDDESFSYTLDRRDGQWRIDSLPPGTLVSSTTFVGYYRLSKLYFFDASSAVLVPDLRYSSLQGQGLASWLLQQLTTGSPRPELLAAGVLNDVPDQSGKATVAYGDPISIDMPGAAQLTADERNSLAAQLAYTFGEIQNSSGDLRLTDSGRPVTVPAVGGNTFSTAEFHSVDPDNQPSISSYYVRDGGVYSASGTVYPTSAKLDSVAVLQVSNASQPKQVLLAGVSQSGRLFTGEPSSLKQISLPSTPTSRPEWGPQGDDIWVGVGSALYRVTNGQPARAITVNTPAGGPPGGVITAVRFSPDGVRVAMVIRPAKGVGTLWIGSVVTSGSSIRIESAEPITPPLISVSDVAWADDTRLYMLTTPPGGNAAGVSELFSDGSGLTAENSLPGSVSATSMTASPQEDAIVSANGLLYEKVGSQWVNLGDNGPVSGTNPIYGS